MMKPMQVAVHVRDYSAHARPLRAMIADGR